jgi:hypothetical protein
MPYLCVKSSTAIPDATFDKLQSEIGRLIPIIKNKTIDNCMIQIEDNCRLFVSGGPVNAVFCEVRMFGKASSLEKEEFSGELYKLFLREINPKMIYINFLEFDEWRSGDTYKRV